MTDLELYEALTGAFLRSTQTGKPVPLTLERGLKARAQQKPGGARGLLLWRDSDMLPSASTCERLALACGFLKPAYKQQQHEGHDGLLMTEGADWSSQCEHDWAEPECSTKGQTSTELTRCKSCGIELTIATRLLKGKPTVKRLYGGQKVSEQLLARLRHSGPVPAGQQADQSPAEPPQLPQEEQQQPEPAQAPAPALDPQPQPAQHHSGQVCATCRYGQPDGYGLIECQLGWPEHDPVFWVEYQEKDKDGTPKTRAEERVTDLGMKYTVQVPVSKWVKSSKAVVAHGEATMPLLAPQTSCMCRGGSKWLPRAEDLQRT